MREVPNQLQRRASDAEKDARATQTEKGNVPTAVEIERRRTSVSRDCNGAVGARTVELRVVLLQRGDELAHLSIAPDTTEAALRFQHSSGAPAQDHLAAAPALHTA